MKELDKSTIFEPVVFAKRMAAIGALLVLPLVSSRAMADCDTMIPNSAPLISAVGARSLATPEHSFPKQKPSPFKGMSKDLVLLNGQKWIVKRSADGGEIVGFLSLDSGQAVDVSGIKSAQAGASAGTQESGVAVQSLSGCNGATLVWHDLLGFLELNAMLMAQGSYWMDQYQAWGSRQEDSEWRKMMCQADLAACIRKNESDKMWAAAGRFQP